MTRTNKYSETKTFHYHNQNPYNLITSDCVIRAISTATGKSYNDVVLELAMLHCDTGYDDGDAKLYEKYLVSLGWVKHKQPRRIDGSKFTGKDFCLALQDDYDYVIGKTKPYIAHIGGHYIVAIIDAKVYDIWDCTDKCIGNYWTPKTFI